MHPRHRFRTEVYKNPPGFHLQRTFSPLSPHSELLRSHNRKEKDQSWKKSPVQSQAGLQSDFGISPEGYGFPCSIPTFPVHSCSRGRLPSDRNARRIRSPGNRGGWPRQPVLRGCLPRHKTSYEYGNWTPSNHLLLLHLVINNMAGGKLFTNFLR